ncbi:MAG: translation initiation factor IF-2 N-terminal domain-containing protein, partial [Collinsella aerofaciens]
MAKVRVSTLAKEFGMTSKELMGHLAEMKIPAKSASSALEDAYVAMVRKQLASVIEARLRKSRPPSRPRSRQLPRGGRPRRRGRARAHRRREGARGAPPVCRSPGCRGGCPRGGRGQEKAEQERLAREKEEAAREAQRRAVPASDSGSRFRSLLDQIAAQETVLKEKKDAEEKAKAERASERGNRRSGNNDRRGGRRNDRNASDNNSDR